MNDKFYETSYSGSQCAKQVPTFNQQQYYYPNMQINTTYPQNSPILDSYITNSLQNSNNIKYPNICPTVNSYPEQEFPSSSSWDGIADKTLKPPSSSDKFEMIEISSKDLSPASYCSNLDMILPDFYKNLNYTNNWYSNNYNQKIDLPSCQVNQNMDNEKTVKYCSIQKPQNQEYYENYDQCFYTNCNNKNFPNNKEVDMQDYNTLFYQNYNNFNYQNIDQQTECSNEESDIIVEESDDEITDYGEFTDKKQTYKTNKCIICNIAYNPLGTQFYYLTLESPLTMSSQKPVYYKVLSIVKKCKRGSYLCSECLGLINTIDHLQLKLEGFKTELLQKFRLNHNSQNNKIRIKRRFNCDKIPSFRCRQCKKILNFKQYCNLHIKKHKLKGILCELCGKIFENQMKFQSHYNQHQPSVPKIDSYQCKNCPKYFRKKFDLKIHENYCLGLLPYKCKLQNCGKKFTTKSKLKTHIKLKHEKKFIAICSICNIGFVRISDYKSHMISHSTDKKFPCPKCDKSYKTLSNLNFHIKVHNDKLPFNCNICNRGFMRREYLEAHINKHNGLKNFTCPICDKKFISQKYLDTHSKYHDNSVQPKICNICGKSISTNFEEHLRVHNNLREFECDQCDLKFNTKGTLAKHKKKKHSKNK